MDHSRCLGRSDQHGIDGVRSYILSLTLKSTQPGATEGYEHIDHSNANVSTVNDTTASEGVTSVVTSEVTDQVTGMVTQYKEIRNQKEENIYRESTREARIP